MTRDALLQRVRSALGRTADQPPAAAPPARIAIPQVALDARISAMCRAIEALAGRAYVAETPEAARDVVARVLAGRTAVASAAPVLADCGIASLDGVCAGVSDCAALRDLCASCGVGITGADYALADTGSLVLFSSREEARLISLLPPAHVAVVRKERILTGLDELLSLEPLPAGRSSSMVLITGPSRTADIEQILVRGVHGPGEFHVVIV